MVALNVLAGAHSVRTSPPQLVHRLRMERQTRKLEKGDEETSGLTTTPPKSSNANATASKKNSSSRGDKGTKESKKKKKKKKSKSKSMDGHRSRTPPSATGNARRSTRGRSSSERKKLHHVASLMSFNNMAHSCSVTVTSATTPPPTRDSPTMNTALSVAENASPVEFLSHADVHRNSPSRIHDAFIGVVGVPVALQHDPQVLVPEARLAMNGTGQPGSFHEYLVEYTTDMGELLSCWIRYSELRREATSLRQLSPMEFPPKAAIFQSSTTKEFVERRRADIEAWLEFEMRRSEAGHAFIKRLVTEEREPKSPTFMC